uniref:Uncharacterized protein n=1 Tax=Myotis myotis TaxID=51298 RepID=A0A7J7R7D3_MYOMY|nr:hypothetical protein mMyoMyo1_010875 [Myotis myotis]
MPQLGHQSADSLATWRMPPGSGDSPEMPGSSGCDPAMVMIRPRRGALLSTASGVASSPGVISCTALGFQWCPKACEKEPAPPVQCQGCAGLPGAMTPAQAAAGTSLAGGVSLTSVRSSWWPRSPPSREEEAAAPPEPLLPGALDGLGVTESCPSAPQPPRGACGSAAPAWGPPWRPHREAFRSSPGSRVPLRAYWTPRSPCLPCCLRGCHTGSEDVAHEDACPEPWRPFAQLFVVHGTVTFGASAGRGLTRWAVGRLADSLSPVPGTPGGAGHTAVSVAGCLPEPRCPHGTTGRSRPPSPRDAAGADGGALSANHTPDEKTEPPNNSELIRFLFLTGGR